MVDPLLATYKSKDKMDSTIIGRQAEQKILEQLFHSKEPELLAIYGRRRLGKTFLIRSYYRHTLVFTCTGQYNEKTRRQLINFAEQLNLHFPEQKTIRAPATWQEAFSNLRERLDSLDGAGKKVILFDELSWLDTRKSGFLSAFGYFWNTYLAQRGDILTVICCSAVSWAIEKVVNNKGGLHNRVTQRIRLLPFTLHETQAYLKQRHAGLDHYQLLRLYMVMGGVPVYLNAVKRGLSAEQNIENCCFSKDGFLTNEFNNLYAALFSNPHNHLEVIRALARKNKGLTRTEILKAGKLLTGGTITKVLTELVESGFIQKIRPFGKKEKDSLFRLIDEYSLFYLKFMEKDDRQGDWPGIQKTQAYTAWGGYAFENICFKHIAQIKTALQIGGVITNTSSWVQNGRGEAPGAQIDMVIDRADNCINVCEMKFSTGETVIDKKYADSLENKLSVFRQNTGTKKTLFLTIITTHGVADNAYKTRVDAEITMDALFAPSTPRT
jgi:AAA+ ATPase superfamily predicted ATPase